MSALLLVLAILHSLIWAVSVARLGVMRERHHYWIGLGVLVLGWWLGAWWLAWLGLLVMADDALQHFVQLRYPEHRSILHLLYRHTLFAWLHHSPSLEALVNRYLIPALMAVVGIILLVTGSRFGGPVTRGKDARVALLSHDTVPASQQDGDTTVYRFETTHKAFADPVKTVAGILLLIGAGVLAFRKRAPVAAPATETNVARWSCSRCGTMNPTTVTTCANCGTLRNGKL